MKKKQFISWFALLMGVFLLFFAGDSQVKADTASDVDSAISIGVNYTSNKTTLDSWDASILAFSNSGLTDAQAQNFYNNVITNNPFISGKEPVGSSIGNVAAVNGLRAIGKDPTRVNTKNLVPEIINDPSIDPTDYRDLINIANDLEALSTGNYGSASEQARISLVEKLLLIQDSKTHLWNTKYSPIDIDGRILLGLSMNENLPGVKTAISEAVTGITNTYYQKNGGFSNDSQNINDDEYNDITMVNGLAAAGVDVYSPLNGEADYKSPVQNLLDQNVTSPDGFYMLIQQGTYTLQQAKFTHDGGKGSIFAFDQNAAAKPGTLASFKAAATARKQAIINDSQATAAAKNDALNLVDQVLATYVSKINADTTSSAAIADQADGVTAVNNVNASHTAVPTTPTTPATTVTNNYTTVVNSSARSSSTSTPTTSSSGSAPTTTTTVTKKPAKKAAQAKQPVVYALTTVKLYKNTNFTKSNLSKTYNKRARINRPMFLVISQRTNKQGHAIYRVKDMNSGKTGYTLSGSKYFAHAYYSAKVTRIKVINPKGINEYGKVNLTSKKRHVKKNASLNVKKVVNYGRSNRMQLTNGHYITANKKLILATKIKKSSQNTRPSTPAATITGTTTSNPSTNSGSTTTTTTTNTNSKPTTTGTTATTNSPSATPTLPVTPTNPVTSSNDAKTITTTISIHADGATLASGSIKVNSGASAFDALQAFAQQQGLTLTYKGSGATAYVTGISGYIAGPAGTMTGWLYSINGTEPGSSMGAYILKDGDQISMTYNK